MPERVRITDVSPRDGLQNEPGVIPTADKVRLIELLCKTGVDEIEVTSFVSPKWVPQLGDAAQVLAALKDHKPPTMCFSALVPNEKGMLEALKVEPGALDKISLFTAASESFSKRNTNASIAQTIERFRPVVDRARQHGFVVRAYISCVIACPFEGPIAPQAVAQVASSLAQLGVDEIDLGDTIGAAAPDSVRLLLTTLRHALPPELVENITLHLHDTFGRAAECVKAALDLGVRSFDGSVAGLGGCPYASKTLPDGSVQRAPGNISTETLVHTIHNAGFSTGVNLTRLAEAADFARSIVAKSRVASPGTTS